MDDEQAFSSIYHSYEENVMKKISNVIACIFIAVSVYAFIEAGTFPPGSNGALGPGFFPRALAVLVVFLSALQLITSARSTVPEGQEEVTLFRKENLKVWIALAGVIFYVWTLKFIGFKIMTPVYLFGMLLYFKVKNKAILACVPIGVTVVLYIIFSMVLHVQLPKGLI